MKFLQWLYLRCCALVIVGAVCYVCFNLGVGFLGCLESGVWPTTGEHGPENKDYQWMQEVEQ